MRSEDFKTQFTAPVRERGADYLRGRTITLGACTPTAIRARARGSRDYAVRIEVIARTLTLECTCPYFLNEGPCKHLWATVLLAEERGVLAPLPAWTQVYNVGLTQEDLEADLLVDEIDDDQPEDAGAVSVAAGRAAAGVIRSTPLFPRLARGPAAPAPEPPRPAWQALLAEARRVSGLREPSVAPPPATLLYVVDLDRMRSSGDLVVTLRTRSRKKDGQWTKDKPASVAYRSLELVGDPLDRRALPLYQAAADIGHSTASGYYGSAYGYGYGRGGPSFATEAPVPPALGDELLSLLSETGRLFVRETHDGPLSPTVYQGHPPWTSCCGWYVARTARAARSGAACGAARRPSISSSRCWCLPRGG